MSISSSTETVAPFAFNRLEPKFCRARLALDVHMPRFAPVIRIKEKTKSPLTENRRHVTSLRNELYDAKTAISTENQQSIITRLRCTRVRDPCTYTLDRNSSSPSPCLPRRSG